MCVPLITQLLRLAGRLGTRKPVEPHKLGGCRYSNRPSRSVRNSCVIEVFGGVFVLIFL